MKARVIVINGRYYPQVKVLFLFWLYLYKYKTNGTFTKSFESTATIEYPERYSHNTIADAVEIIDQYRFYIKHKNDKPNKSVVLTL